MPGRWWRWITEQCAFLLVLIGIAAALLYLLVRPEQWRPGTAAVAAVVLFAGAVRLLVPTARVGSLAVRSRPVDSLVYLVLGGLILAVDIRLHG